MVAGLCIILAAVVGLVSYAPTLFQLYAAATSHGSGVPRRTTTGPSGMSDETVTVHFDANVQPGLDWEFRPEKGRMTVRFGEPAKVYFDATNLSGKALVGRAVFNVIPYQATPYFFKIKSFASTDQRLGPGESARIPVMFYLDRQMLNDKAARGFREVTLSYTFFSQDRLTPDEVAAVRDLSAGSRALDERLKADEKVVYENDAPRQ